MANVSGCVLDKLPLSRPIRDFDRMAFELDKVSKTCGADSIFEFFESMDNYKIIYNYKDFCLMVSIRPTLYYFDVQVEIGIVPVFSNKEEYKPMNVYDLKKIPEDRHEAYQKAKEKKEEIEQKIRAVLDY